MAVVSGGTTLIDNGALDAAVPTGSLTLLSTQTASASATISFTSGIDSTYDSYVFKFIDIHPATDNTYLTFQTSTDGGSNYNTTTTSTCFKAFRSEASGTTEGLNYEFGYRADSDQAQGTSYQRLHGDGGIGNDNDQSLCSTLQLFNPSSATFVKHYIITTGAATAPNYFVNSFVAGYFNTTSAINAIQFKMSSGNIDSGTIKMYGVA
jgi:thiamine pyrophosphokinase